MKSKSAAVTIAVTLGQLVAGQRSGWTADQDLVIAALRRSTNRLADASEDELGAYLSGLSPAQMQGVVSNVKGIFHEMLIVAAENADGDAVAASLFDVTNHPGADIEYLVDGDVIGSVQAKAVQDPAAIIDHFARFPDQSVVATTEVCDLLQGVFGERLSSSDFSNEEITRTTRDTFQDLAGEDIGDFLQDGILTSTLIGGALQARAVLSGQSIQPAQVRSFLELAGVSAGTAFAVDAVLNLI